MNLIFTLTLLLWLIPKSEAAATTTFCAASCVTCTSPAPSDCTLCQLPLTSSNGACSAANQATTFTS